MNFTVIRKIIVSKFTEPFYCTTRKFSVNTGISYEKKITGNFHKIKNFTCFNILSYNSSTYSKYKKPDSIGIQENISVLQVKKRPVRRKRSLADDDNISTSGLYTVKALATAEEYRLEDLVYGLLKENLYTPNDLYSSTNSLPDVIHATAKYDIGQEPREIFFFREGTVVMWNISELESANILDFIKKYEDNRYTLDLVQAESEIMVYSYGEPGKKSHLKNGDIILSPNVTTLDKYTFSNAISQSVKLGIWEASLNHYVDSIEFVSEDLKLGKKLRMTQEEVLRKQGELFALRHLINLSSDLLDTPDFYWERDDLENLYRHICAYFSISKRTHVMNEKLNHCVELIGIVSSHLSDRHHIRLEWMIIILIMVEVGFEILHYIDRYFVK